MVSGPGTVYFLSDYGRRDEFVGVVHAVLRRLSPAAVVIDLTHEVPPFDVRAGAGALLRCLPHLGPGVVLAVVDPGVGGPRRGLLLDAGESTGGPRWFVGPDNGLLVPATEAAGGIAEAVELAQEPGRDAATFDGRDLFAPVAAAVLLGQPARSVGRPVPADELVRLPPPVVEQGVLADGRGFLRAEVTWVDRFGNVQLAAPVESLPDEVSLVVVTIDPHGERVPDDRGSAQLARRVRTFSDLERGEVGVLGDANGHLAVVVREGSGAERFGAHVGMLVDLLW